jgi:NAD-dependent DNA ligase
LQVWKFAVTQPEELGNFGLEPGTRLHEIFVQAFKNIKSIPYEKVVQCLGIENVGRKITKQLALEHAGLPFTYTSLEKALVAKLHEPIVETYIKSAIASVEALGTIVDRPENPKEGGIKIEFTGSPKSAGFKTKQEFLDLIKKYNVIHYGLKTDTDYLITDSLNSSSSKMKKAEKYNVKIVTYIDFKEILLK